MERDSSGEVVSELTPTSLCPLPLDPPTSAGDLNPAFPITQGLDYDDWHLSLGVKDIPSMMNEVKCLVLLAKVYKNHKKEDVVETLNQVSDPRSLPVVRRKGVGLMVLGESLRGNLAWGT